MMQTGEQTRHQPRPLAALLRAAAGLALLLGVVALASGCTRIAPQRTLPASIRTISVPMAINRSAEPGIEEMVTVYVQEEFLADGRLDLQRHNDADAIIEVEIRDWVASPQGFDGDDIVTSQSFDVETRIRIIRNIPQKPLIGEERVLETSWFRNSDQRGIGFEPEPRAKEEAIRRLARDIVREVITGAPTAPKQPGNDEADGQ